MICQASKNPFNVLSLGECYNWMHNRRYWRQKTAVSLKAHFEFLHSKGALMKGVTLVRSPQRHKLILTLNVWFEKSCKDEVISRPCQSKVGCFNTNMQLVCYLMWSGISLPAVIINLLVLFYSFKQPLAVLSVYSQCEWLQLLAVVCDCCFHGLLVTKWKK